MGYGTGRHAGPSPTGAEGTGSAAFFLISLHAPDSPVVAFDDFVQDAQNLLAVCLALAECRHGQVPLADPGLPLEATCNRLLATLRHPDAAADVLVIAQVRPHPPADEARAMTGSK